MNERTCCACRTKTDKQRLLRICKNKSGQLFVDIMQSQDGRGAYICSAECAKRAKKTKALNRTFKSQIDDQIYDNAIALSTEYFT